MNSENVRVIFFLFFELNFNGLLLKFEINFKRKQKFKRKTVKINGNYLKKRRKMKGFVSGYKISIHYKMQLQHF